jgi:hypothetical protein
MPFPRLPVRGGTAVKKWTALLSATAGAAVLVALLAGKDDIRRLRRMRSM